MFLINGFYKFITFNFIQNNSSYFLQGYETSSSSSNHKGHYPHTSSSSTRLPNASEVGNVVEPNMQQKENGLTQNQELTADELLANIQSAVDELLLDYQPSPQPEILPEKNTMMTKVQEKFTSETTHKNEVRDKDQKLNKLILLFHCIGVSCLSCTFLPHTTILFNLT